MRGFLLLSVFVAIVIATAVYPFAGLLSWAWFSFMHPHRETFGFAYDFQFDFYLALLTMVAWLLSGERKFVPMGLTPALLAAFAIWICVTTYVAIDPDFSYPLWERTEKSLLLVLFVMLMATSKARLHALVWIIAISLGYYAVKGAGFVLLSGSGLVFGPDQSMISDNNALSVALATLLPLLLYLIRTSHQSWVRIGCIAVAVAIVITIVGTFSRGGFLALLTVGGLLALRSRARISMAVAGVLVLIVMFQVVPQSWRDRMDTIWGVGTDTSVEGRFQAWQVAINVTKERPLTGGGFRFGEQQRIWDRYTGLPASVPFHAAHNIYFEVLGEHGLVGLILYLAIMLSCIRNTQIAARLARDRPDAWSAGELANALQLSILCLAVAGNSLSIAYYDVYLTLYGMTFALRSLMERASVASQVMRPAEQISIDRSVEAVGRQRRI